MKEQNKKGKVAAEEMARAMVAAGDEKRAEGRRSGQRYRQVSCSAYAVFLGNQLKHH